VARRSDGLLTPEEEEELPPERPETTGPEPHWSSVGAACVRSIDRGPELRENSASIKFAGRFQVNVTSPRT
jgi:hypothetical protein